MGKTEDVIMDDLLPYMVRAPLNLLHIYVLKHTERYHSSLRKIFDLLSFAGDKERLDEYMNEHEQDYSSLYSVSGRMMALLLGLELPVKTGDEAKEAGYNMCEAVRQMRESSRAEGRAEGEEHGKREVVLNMLSKNLSLEQIADLTGVALETVREIANNR